MKSKNEFKKIDLRFGPAGVPIQCDGTSTLDGVICCHDLGLGAMEMEFVRGVRLSEQHAEEVRKKAEELDIRLSSHAPYYINLCNPEKFETTFRNLTQSAHITATAGGWITVFHPGYYQKHSKQEAYKIAKQNLLKIEEYLKQHNIKIILGAETVGKKSQFGGLDEVIRLSEDIESVYPVIDFAHLHARGDVKIKSKDDYKKIFDKLESHLGTYINHFHSHFSEIEYTEKGERNHLNLGTKNEPPFRPLLQLIHENGYGGTIISETPQIDIDAIKMKKYYTKLNIQN